MLGKIKGTIGVVPDTVTDRIVQLDGLCYRNIRFPCDVTGIPDYFLMVAIDDGRGQEIALVYRFDDCLLDRTP